MTLLLIVNELVHLIRHVLHELDKTPANQLYYYYSTSIVLIVSFAIALALILGDHRNGYISSGLMFTFWSFLTTFSTFILYSKIIKLSNKENKVRCDFC